MPLAARTGDLDAGALETFAGFRAFAYGYPIMTLLAVVAPFFLLAIPYGPLVICYVAVLHTVVDITCSTYCLKRFLGIELRQYARVAKYFFLSLLACAPAALVCALVASPWVSLPVGAVSAGLLYWGLLRRDENMKECLSVLAGFVRAR